VLKDDGLDLEIGSIGIQHGNGATEFWAWGIDTVIPIREAEAEGSGKDRNACMRQFKAAWDRFSAGPARLAEFVQAKRTRFG
jgi:hypothetical protein